MYFRSLLSTISLKKIFGSTSPLLTNLQESNSNHIPSISHYFGWRWCMTWLLWTRVFQQTPSLNRTSHSCLWWQKLCNFWKWKAYLKVFFIKKRNLYCSIPLKELKLIFTCSLYSFSLIVVHFLPKKIDIRSNFSLVQ